MKRRDGLALAGGALVALAAMRRARAATAIRLATLPVDGTALPYYAKDLHSFDDAGLDVAIQIITNGAAVISAALGGSIDIGWSEMTALAAAYSRGLPVTIIGAGGMHTPGSLATQLMVRKDSPLQTARDLGGKTIGCTSLANIAQYAPEAWIDKNGGTSRLVKFVEVPLPELPAALEQGRVDAAWLAEPFVEAAAPFARTFALCFDAVAPRWMLGAWFTTAAWAAAHRDAVDAFRAVMRKTASWANENRQQSGAILAKYGHLDPSVVRAMVRIEYATQPEPALIQPAIELAVRYGAVRASFPAQRLLYVG